MSQTIVNAGYLQKESVYLKKFRKRWIVFKGSYLYSYKTDKCDKLTEQIDIKSFNSVKEVECDEVGKFKFKLMSNGSNRTFIASTKLEMNKWIQVLQQVIHSKADILNMYSKLINMGMDDNVSLDAAKQYTSDINKAITYVLEHQTDIDKKDEIQQSDPSTDWKHEQNVSDENLDDEKLDDRVIRFTQDQALYKGGVHTDDGSELYGVLCKTSIRLYIIKNLNQVPYDVISILQYKKVTKSVTGSPDIPFSIVLSDMLGTHELLFAFKNEENRDNWYAALLKLLVAPYSFPQLLIQNSVAENHVIYSSWTLYQKELLFMELTKDRHFRLYDAKNIERRKCLGIISLNTCNKVVLHQYEDALTAALNIYVDDKNANIYVDDQKTSNPDCICGDVFKNTDVATLISLYPEAEHAVVFCSICWKRCEGIETISYCQKEIEKHPFGFAVCENCKYKDRSEMKYATEVKMMKIGYYPAQIVVALEQTNGNEDTAIEYLDRFITEQSMFRYGFTLQRCGDNQDMLFLFKQNNDRYSWISHIDFAIEKRTVAKTDERKSNQMNKSSNIAKHSSIEIILSVLLIYDKWVSAQEKTNSLIDILECELHVKYVDLLKHFHEIIKCGEHLQHSQYQCTSDSYNCEYKSRHTNRHEKTQNEINFGFNDENDIILFELLDKIHFILYHSQDVRKNVNDKFVINIKSTENMMNDNDDVKYDEDSRMHAAVFAFGELFGYYDDDKHASNYIAPVYDTLKHELLRNPYYKLSMNKYNKYYVKSVELMKTEEFKSIKALDMGTDTQRIGIYPSDPIYINHIISLMIYSNETDAQKIYKENCRKLFMKETRANVYKRHSFICHWTRNLQESCMFYGTCLKPNESVYCGINTKLLFNSIEFVTNAPLSTSTDITVANNFATIDGIILKIQRADDDTSCKYFDMMLISDYIQEKERFFCGFARLKIFDIIIEKSYKHEIYAIQLLDVILKGTLFYYEWNEHLFENEIQIMLIKLLNNFVKKTLLDHKNEIDYVQSLVNNILNEFTKTTAENDIFYKGLIYINIPQISNLNDDLAKYFCLNTVNTERGLLLSSYFKDVSVKFIEKVNTITLSGYKLNQVKNMEIYGGEGIEICNFIVEYQNTPYKFKIAIQMRERMDGDCVAIVIHLMSQIQTGIEILWDVVCVEVQYSKLSSYMMLQNGCYRDLKGILAFSLTDIQNINELTIVSSLKIVGLPRL
eukprot:547453_1